MALVLNCLNHVQVLNKECITKLKINNRSIIIKFRSECLALKKRKFKSINIENGRNGSDEEIIYFFARN